ncbi:MAG: hypothetical protein PGN26_15565 [Xylophilus ampelinus]
MPVTFLPQSLKSTSGHALRKIAVVGVATLHAIPALAADRIEPGPQDTRDYLCAVSQVNPDGSGSNFWTNAARGGKFEAVSPRKVRVVSSSPEAAVKEIYAFYQATAPQYRGIDRGKSPQSYVVESCADDPSSTRGVKLQALPLERYRFLQKDKEFIELFLAMNKDPVADEQLVKLYDRRAQMPFDAFEKRDLVQKRVAAIREKVKATQPGPVQVSTRAYLAKAYDFEKNRFDLGDITRVEYSYLSGNDQPVMPRFTVSDPGNLRFYTPSSQEEAKRIEQARVSGGITVRTYIQPTKAWLNEGQPQINGVIAAIELRDKKDAVLGRVVAR